MDVVSNHGYVFELPILSSLDPKSYNFNPTLETNVKLFFTTIMFHHLQMCNYLLVLSEDLRHWVKLKCIIWFSQFLLTKYNDHRWVENFKMMKQICLKLLNNYDLFG